MRGLGSEISVLQAVADDDRIFERIESKQRGIKVNKKIVCGLVFATVFGVGADAAERLPAGTYLTKAEVCAQDDFGSGKKDNLGPEDFLVVGRDGSISFYETLCKPKRGKANAFICDSGGAYSGDGATMKVDVVREEDRKVKAVKIEKALFYYCGGKVLKPLI